ncbi:hypothetical protein SK128_002791, partial [Halocaridina rubra]
FMFECNTINTQMFYKANDLIWKRFSHVLRSSEADEQDNIISDLNAVPLTDTVFAASSQLEDCISTQGNEISTEVILSSDIHVSDKSECSSSSSCCSIKLREKNGKEEEGLYCGKEVEKLDEVEALTLEPPLGFADNDLNISVSAVVTAFGEVKSELKNAVKDAHCELVSTVSEVRNELSHVFIGTNLCHSHIYGECKDANWSDVEAKESDMSVDEKEIHESLSYDTENLNISFPIATQSEKMNECHYQQHMSESCSNVVAERIFTDNVISSTDISTGVNTMLTSNGMNTESTDHVKNKLENTENLEDNKNVVKLSSSEDLNHSQNVGIIHVQSLTHQSTTKDSASEALDDKGIITSNTLSATSAETLQKQTVSAPSTPVPSASGSLRKVLRVQGCQGRRVSFPEDDTRLISSYLEPVNPWQKMGGVTVDEIAAAYRTSCERHRTQPLPGVLQQIKALPLVVGGRVECISLRGQRLEGGQCEGLEEIFRRVQFKILDLEGCSLDDDTAIPLFDMIEFYDSATQLNISCNSKIGFRGWQACARMLKRTPSVEYLDARNTNLNETNMPILGRALRLGARLHTLHLENCNLTGRPLIMLTAALKQNDTLAELYLAENRLGVNDCIQLGNLVRANNTLRVLDLRNNNVQDAGCGHISEGITEQQMQQLETDDCGSDTKREAKGLNSLILWNNHLTQQSAPHLATLLASTSSLEMLNLGRNNLTSEGILRLKESLLRNRSLLRLGLQAARIGDEGAVALAEYTADNIVIQQIDLRENPVHVAGLMALAHSMRVNTTITQLDLDSDPRTEPSAELAEQHSSLQKEIKEYCQRNLTHSHLRDAKVNSSEGSINLPIVDQDRLSVNSVIRKVSLTCETSHKPASLDTVNDTPIQEEEKQKYVSPAPSPLPSPSPSPCASPSPSPVPSPLKNRFRVFRVQEASRSTSQLPLNTSVCSSSVCSSAPVSQSGRSMSAGDLSLTKPAQPALRPNRFSIGGRFTVTRVTEASGSSSLPSNTVTASSSELSPTGTASSPKIVISSPIRVERGFSIEDASTHTSKSGMFFLENTGDINSTPAKSKVMGDNTESLPESCQKRQVSLSAHTVRLKSDSDSDEVFVESTNLNSNSGSSIKSSSFENSGGEKDNDSLSSCELTDSGFLDDSMCGGNRGGVGCSISSGTCSPHPEGDRDSLLSSSVDSTSQEDAGLNSSMSCSSNFQSTLPSVSSLLSCSVQHPVQPIPAETLKRAPLAAMENGSFDSDSEDSEVTTQSSDSTHSDEVRIMTEQLIPRPAWELKQDSVVEMPQPITDASVKTAGASETG